MKDNRFRTLLFRRGRWLKFGLTMKLLVLLSIFSTSHLFANAHEQAMRVSLNVKNASLEEVIRILEKESGYLFLYEDAQIESIKNLQLKFDNEELKVVLDKCLENSALDYKLMNQTIVIYREKNMKRESNFQKDIVIKGVVKDAKEGLPGATVICKGTTSGTTTDADGRFILKLSGQKKPILLEVSFIGMQSKEVLWQGEEDLTIELVEGVKEMEEVVVTGYFNKSKSSFTGTAKSYTAEELKQVNPVNLLSALSILDPSFKMTENNLDGSNPNVIPEFQIRGTASMPSTSELKSSFVGNPNLPTFIMDGFEVSAEKVFDLDPMRIESMTILKDAAATAIYGSRASNGVIVINTKQPEAGKLRLLYNIDVSFNIPDLTDYDLLNAAEKLELEKAAGYFNPLGTIDQTEARERDYNYRLGLVQQGYNTYWLDKPLKTAVSHKHSLSVEGGEKAIRYALDLTYEDAPGVMKESGRQRMGMGTMLLYRFKNLTFRNNMTYDNVKSTNSPYGSFRQYTTLNPYYPYQDENGNYLQKLEETSGMLGRASVINPLYNTTLNVVDETSYSEFANNFGIDWFINADLRLKGNFAIRHKKNEGTVFKPANHTDFVNYSDNNYYRRGYYQATSGKEFFYDGNIVLSYFKQLENHHLNANVAWNIQGNEGEIYTVRAEGFPDEKLDFITFAAQNAEEYLPQGEDYISRLMGFVGNASYTYRDCYLLDASVRFDGSSKFGSDGRWATFWSAGLGWNIHKEKFARNWTWANMLKIRASYGMTGSQAFEPYQSIIMYQYYTQNRYQHNIGAIMMGLGNPNLKWQQTNQLNIGTDISVLNDRVSISANYYQNRSKDLLTNVTLPPSLGYGTYRENLGEIENKGYELEVRLGIIRKKNLWLNLTASGIHNTNILKKISNSLKSWNQAQDESNENLNVPKVRYIEGESINSIWGVPSLGINPANGKETYLAADGSLTDIWSAKDQRVIGCTDPNLYGNLGLNAGWKGLQLNLYFTYRLGGQNYNYTLVERVENADKRYNTDRRVLEQRWQKPGDITFFKDIKDNSLTRPTSRFVEDYNYLQLSALNLSYDFPTSLTRKWKMENIRISFSMNDVFRASSIKAERGLDYPFARSFRTSLRIIL